MVVGYHLICTAYGWWLPNDPRGSMSHQIRVEHIEALGDLHFGRKRIQPSSREVRDFHAKAEGALKHELLEFDQDDREMIALAFEETLRRRCYTCYAAAIMPNHVHLLIRKHRDQAEEMLEAFQERSRNHLRQHHRRNAVHPVWGGPGWKVFLHERRDVERTVKYIEENPGKARLPAQNWGFVTPYDGWMPGLR